MSKADLKGEEIIAAIESNQTIPSIKQSMNLTDDQWYRYSSKANQIYLARQIKDREAFLKRPHTSGTSREKINELLTANDILADYALCMNIFSTEGELNQVNKLIPDLPKTELKLIALIGNVTMHPKMRVLQKKGRIEKLPHFNLFTKMVDAATLCYYRTNFTSCYMTLLPVIEGIIIRWMGYSDRTEKPEFEEIRKFFKNSYMRQPCPYNILFHNVFAKACDKILNNHFYKPTANGSAYANFNRHVASHILNDGQFATKENCIRLFILLDAMTEIYLLESRQPDARFNLDPEEIDSEIELLSKVMLSNLETSPEHILLNTSASDILNLGK